MKRLLRKLVNSETWGGKHTPLDRLVKVLPSHIRGSKAVRLALRELVQKDFVLMKKSTGETHVSLNPRSKQEIFSFLEN